MTRSHNITSPQLGTNFIVLQSVWMVIISIISGPLLSTMSANMLERSWRIIQSLSHVHQSTPCYLSGDLLSDGATTLAYRPTTPPCTMCSTWVLSPPQRNNEEDGSTGLCRGATGLPWAKMTSGVSRPMWVSALEASAQLCVSPPLRDLLTLTFLSLQSTNGMFVLCFRRQFLDSDMPRYIIMIFYIRSPLTLFS